MSNTTAAIPQGMRRGLRPKNTEVNQRQSDTVVSHPLALLARLKTARAQEETPSYFLHLHSSPRNEVPVVRGLCQDHEPAGASAIPETRSAIRDVPTPWPQPSASAGVGHGWRGTTAPGAGRRGVMQTFRSLQGAKRQETINDPSAAMKGFLRFYEEVRVHEQSVKSSASSQVVPRRYARRGMAWAEKYGWRSRRTAERVGGRLRARCW